MTQDSVARQSLLSRPARRLVRQTLITLSLLLLLFTTLLSEWAFPLPYVYASGQPHPQAIPGNLTFQKFLQQSALVAQRKGHFVRPLTYPQVPRAHNEPLSNAVHLPPSAEPPSMKPISQVLDPMFLTGGASVKPLDLVGSDQRLEVQLQPGSLDLSQAALATSGTAPQGPLTLTLSQIRGHYAASF